MSLSNNIVSFACLGSSQPLGAGLTITYSGVNKATISGTPSAVTNLLMRVIAYDLSGCGAGLSDTRETATLVIGAAGGGNVAPQIVGSPTSVGAQLGSDALLSVSASGTPTPRYYWYLGAPPPFGSTLVSTSSVLSITNVQYTNAGLYTVIASNVAGVSANTAGQAYLSVCQTPGSNILTLHYTNYVVVSNSVIMASWFTNAPGSSNVYQWQYGLATIVPYSQTASNLSLPAASVYAGRSGVYSVYFNSVVGTTTALNQQEYDSYWAFGTPPGMTTEPPGSSNMLAGGQFAISASCFVNRSPYTNDIVYCQWYQNGTVPVSSGSTTGTVSTVLEGPVPKVTVYTYSNAVANLVLNNVSIGNSGNYTVVFSNYWGSVTSTPTTLTVTQATTPPVITLEPVPQSILAGQNTSLSVTVTGTPPIYYQWQKIGLGNLSNDSVYSGVNTNVLTLTRATLAHAGNYFVTITNVAGSTNSATVALNVSQPPTMSLSPSGPGNAQLTATTIPGLTYVAERTTNLTPPVTWVPYLTNTVPGSGIILIPNPTTNAAQFFRLTFP
jgi:hypothetical protein